MISKILKVSQHHGQYKVTLPRHFVLEMGWDAIGYLMITMLNNNTMIIEPPNPSLPDQTYISVNPSPKQARSWKHNDRA